MVVGAVIVLEGGMLEPEVVESNAAELRALEEVVVLA